MYPLSLSPMAVCANRTGHSGVKMAATKLRHIGGQHLAFLTQFLKVSHFLFNVWSYITWLYAFCLQVSEEVAKLLELKAKLGDEPSKKFVLKCPKVCYYSFSYYIIHYKLYLFQLWLHIWLYIKLCIFV